MSRPGPKRARRLAVLAALVLIVALLSLVLAPPEPSRSSPRPAPTVAAPLARAIRAPALLPDPPLAEPVAPPEAEPDPEEPAPDWLRAGHDAPDCGVPERPPSRVPAGVACSAGEAVTLCAAPGAASAAVSIDALEQVVRQAEVIVGKPRAAGLVVVLHDASTWGDLAGRKRIPAGVTGLYDGSVHVKPQAEAELIETLRHEILHAVLDSAVQCLPRSVHEGLASWFAGEVRENGWLDSLSSGFWAPEDLEVAVGRGVDPRSRSVAYGQAEARVIHAVDGLGEGSVTAWIAWLGQGDRSDPVEAWDALDRPTEAALADTVSDLLFGVPADGAERPAGRICEGEAADWLELGAAAVRRKCGHVEETDQGP